MKKLLTLLLISICFCKCSEQKQNIVFATLPLSEFNAKPFEIPGGDLADSLKRVHDSCMGFSFNANAMLAKKDAFFIGCIVNKRSLEVINTINDLGITQPQLISKFNILTNPCYEKHVLHFPLRSILGESFRLQFPDIDEARNKEINDAITASNDAEMDAGSWIYLDMKNVLKSMLDTVTGAGALRYKSNLIDTSNMVLTAVESITDISFMISPEQGISEPLQALLKTRLSSSTGPNSQYTVQLYYIDNDKFKMTLNGFFPVAGEFMKAELK